MQLARCRVEPFGEERADQRAAINTLEAILAQATELPPEAVIEALANRLQFYLKSNQPAERVLTPAEAQRAHW